MKIKKISCDQFAGVRDVNVQLNDGINVIFGKNESGKSTLVNLLFQTLFQNVCLDGRRDKSFAELYFPKVASDKTKIGAIDGKVYIDAEDGSYVLSKEWGESTTVSLRTPNQIIRDQSIINEELKKILRYGRGVYADMLFSSQRNADASLKEMLDSKISTDTKTEIERVAESLTRAFLQSDGISTNAIRQAIAQKITDISGSYWDDAMNRPVRRNDGKRNANKIGTIHKTYYELEDSRAELAHIKTLEKEADKAKFDYRAIEEDARLAEEKLHKFEKVAGVLEAKKALGDKLKSVESDRRKLEKVLSEWPLCIQQIERAKALNGEKGDREAIDVYDEAKQLYDKLTELRSAREKQICPTDGEISDVRDASIGISILESKLCGMNIAATVKMLGGHSVEVRSLRTGENIDISSGTAALTEAVNITVPGVMEMQLTPSAVDASSIEKQLAEKKALIKTIFDKYKVADIDELERSAKQYKADEMTIKTIELDLSRILSGSKFEELENRLNSITHQPRSKIEIMTEINMLCSGRDLADFIAARIAIKDEYAKEYGDIESLKKKFAEVNKDYESTKSELAQKGEVPDEYRAVTDPQGFERVLKNNADAKKANLMAAIERKSKAEQALQTEMESKQTDPSDMAERVELNERKFNELCEELKHWKHIQKVFEELEQTLSTSPMHDIAESFSKYLKVITGGKVSSALLSRDKLDVGVYTDGRPVDYDKLSEGTKETVSLAFRLAVLDHLFPGGGGVIVFDDPFTDMDAIRTARSIELIKECATRHQVIFLTCKEDCANMLGGIPINL